MLVFRCKNVVKGIFLLEWCWGLCQGCTKSGSEDFQFIYLCSAITKIFFHTYSENWSIFHHIMLIIVCNSGQQYYTIILLLWFQISGLSVFVPNQEGNQFSYGKILLTSFLAGFSGLIQTLAKSLLSLCHCLLKYSAIWQICFYAVNCNVDRFKMLPFCIKMVPQSCSF